jgi:anti-sigma-K factor RskA
MTAHAMADLVPLAALGALDGEERTEFERHLPTCLVCRSEVKTLESVANRIPLALDPVPPSRDLRARVLAAADTRPASASPRRYGLWAGVAAALIVATGLAAVWADRQQARAEAATARQRAALAEAERDRLRGQAEEDRALRALLAHPDSRVVALAGLPAAALAHGRVIWNPDRRQAVLLTLGLAPAPAGKAYELWVIAQAAPVPAGVFQVDAEGRALHRLPPVDTAGAKTFAVTLEPAAGSPAPTGPMVLAGAAS